MSQLATTVLTMSSSDIAELVESRHDHVKRSIERLAERGVIELPPMGEVKNHLNQSVSVYLIGKRDSYIVVAQLSPEFTARLVDRWQELEQAQQQTIPQSFSEALRLAADLAEQKQQLTNELAAAAPKVDLVIFNQTAPVGGDGITMTNAAGQVTFSTLKRPFVYDRQIQITDAFQDIGGGFCQIVYTGVQVRMIGGWGNIRTKGVVMSGGSVRSAYNKVFADRNSGSWDMTRNRNIAMPILILPNMY